LSGVAAHRVARLRVRERRCPVMRIGGEVALDDAQARVMEALAEVMSIRSGQ
jgi:hypothetical protein